MRVNEFGANISIGRNFAGIHWRSDYTESVKLGEAVAISVLEDHRLIYSEPFDGFRFTKFDGTVLRGVDYVGRRMGSTRFANGFRFGF